MQQSESGQVMDRAALEERLRLLEQQLHALQDERARRPGMLLRRMVPPEVSAHLRAAQREQLLALRAWIDVAVKRMEEAPRERPRRPESVRIE